MSDEIDEGMDALRELEVAWLSAALGQSIANIPYPVGMGVAPDAEHLKIAAEKLFERYVKMIEMARRARQH